MGSIGTFSIGSVGLPSTVLHDPPTVVITAPTGTITDLTTTATWNYTSPLSRPQVWYRVVLRTSPGAGGAGVVIYDSGRVVSSATSHPIPNLLSGFTTYRVSVEVSDGPDEATDSRDFFVELSSVADYPDHPDVGSVYEVALNGIGLMLWDQPGGDYRYRRQSAGLEAPRFATSQTPFTEAIDRYTFLGHDDWSGGAGQRHRDLEDSDPRRYWDSEGVDPFTVPGTLRLLEAVDVVLETDYVTPKAVVAGGQVYVATSTTELTALDEPGGTEVEFTAAGEAGDGTWLASDGQFWYWSNGENIYRNDTAADPGSAWSTVDVTEIAWCSDRLVGIDNADSVPNITTFAPDGSEEIPGGRFLIPDAELRGLCGGDGYLWFGVNRGTSCEIHAWQLGSTDEDFIALNLPAGERVLSMFFYLGNVFIATEVEGQTRLYRCVPQTGTLIPEQLLTFDGTEDVTWAGYDRYVAFSWTRAGASGIGLIDLATGGYAKHYASSSSAAVCGVVRWAGRFAFTVAGEGLYHPGADPAFVTEGWLITSIQDLGSGLTKTIDEVTLTTEPLPAVGGIEVEWSPTMFNSWLPIDTMTGVDSGTSARFPIAQQARTVALRFTLTSDGTLTPALRVAQVQLHPVSPVDQVVILPVLCADQADGLNGAPLPDNGEGRSIQLARFVESLVGSRVRLQDLDWPVTGQAHIYDAQSVTIESLSGVYDNSANRRADVFVALLQLRRGQ